MVWKECSAERIWIVSDSRLSDPSQVGERRLSDHAAKILEAPLLLHRSPVGAPQAELIRKSVLGFAYAGSSLVALQAYVAVLPLWSRLEAMDQNALPSVRDCAICLAKFVEDYFMEVGAGCQCVLLGYDYSSGTLAAWVIEARVVDNKATCTMRQLQFRDPDDIEVLGSGRSEAIAKLEAWRERRTAPYWRREPLQMIRESVREDRPGPVGGGVQIGMATSAGFELNFDAQALMADYRIGQPPLRFTYRGFDLDGLTRIGNAFVALRGIGN
jgi:hypothetical protein